HGDMTALLSVPHYVRGRSAHRRHERGDGWVLPSPSAVRDLGAPADRKLEQAYAGRRCRGSELWHQGHALPGADQRQHGDEVVGLMADTGRESAGPAHMLGDDV